MSDLAFPWAGESGLARAVPSCTLDQLLFGWACVQHRQLLRDLAEGRALDALRASL